MDDETRIELEALICEREAYIAENRYREILNNSLAYGSESFFELADRIRALLAPRINCKTDSTNENAPDL